MKIWFTRNLKWLAAGFTMLMTSAAIPIATAEAFESQWLGMGPRVEINGQELYARIEWKEGRTCDIIGPINLRIVVPENSRFLLRGESAGRFDCDKDGIFETSLMTNTTVVEGRRNRNVRVIANVNSPGTRFPVKVALFKDRELTDQCKGFSNRRIRCRGPRFEFMSVEN